MIGVQRSASNSELQSDRTDRSRAPLKRPAHVTVWQLQILILLVRRLVGAWYQWAGGTDLSWMEVEQHDPARTRACRWLGQGRTVDLGVAQMRVLASGGATNGGAFALTRFSGTSEGSWTVPHLHRGFEESFFILDGLFTFTVGEESIAASLECTSWSRGARHTISAAAGGGRFLTLMVPGGLEEMFFELGRLPRNAVRGRLRGRPSLPARLRRCSDDARGDSRAGRRLAANAAPSRRYLRHGSADRLLLFVSGHGAFDGGRPIHIGRLGEELSTAEGIVAAEAVMLNLLATVRPRWATCPESPAS